MAIGLARIFGFRFPENFNYPYSAVSIAGFLAALAYDVVSMVSRLRVHSTRRQSSRPLEDGAQSLGSLFAHRSVARGELELHRLGSLARILLVA